jgi:hypothetical protein
MGQNKLSGYQKLKQENERLKADLSILARFPESEKGILIKIESTTKANIETAIWAGDTGNQNNDGLIKRITDA